MDLEEVPAVAKKQRLKSKRSSQPFLIPPTGSDPHRVKFPPEDLTNTQRLLEESWRRYIDLYDSAPIGYLTLDELGLIWDVNLTAARTLGMDRSRLVGRPFVRFVDPNETQRFVDHLDECRRAAEKVTAELSLVSAEGGPIRAKLITVPVKEGGQPAKFYRMVFMDISDLRKMEEAHRATSEQFQVVMDTAHDAIISSDESGLIVYVNKAAERMFGYPADKILGRPLTHLMPERYRTRHLLGVQRFILTGKSDLIGKINEFSGRRKDGTEFPLEFSVASWRKSGRIFFTSIIRDISERKLLEKEILSISEREQRRIAQDYHDSLSQHLTGIVYMFKALQKKMSLSAEESKAAEKIGRLIAEAVDLGRGLARGLYPVRPESNGLMSALQELSVNIEKMFNVACRFDGEPPVLIDDNAVATHLYRIAQEAVSNAIKHGESRNVWIGLKSSSGRILLTIQDDGVGIGKSETPTGGMGLNIMKYRARMIGATVAVRQTAEGGTLVVCSMDTQDSDPPDSDQPKEAPVTAHGHDAKDKTGF